MAMIEPAPFDRDALLEELNAEAKGVVIPRNFVPFAGGTQNVDLPPEPDENEQPELHRFWTDMFSQPLVFESGDFEYETEVNNQSYGPAAQQPRQQSSLNWSGASITPRDGRMFTEVFATFVVPQVIVPTGADATKEYKSSCWVGLDGQRAYADSTLPQLGTEQVINKGGLPTGPQYSVWIQWWPLPVITIPSLTVSFGQRVYCWVPALSFTRVRCMIKIAAGPGPLHRFYLNSPTINYDRPPLMLGHQAQITGG